MDDTIKVLAELFLEKENFIDFKEGTSKKLNDGSNIKICRPACQSLKVVLCLMVLIRNYLCVACTEQHVFWQKKKSAHLDTTFTGRKDQSFFWTNHHPNLIILS